MCIRDSNYRSHQDIVEASLLVINENLDRFPKILEASELNQRKEETYRETACRVRIKEFRDAPEQMQYLLHRLKGRSTPVSYTHLDVYKRQSRN